jgi:hypothetical protein
MRTIDGGSGLSLDIPVDFDTAQMAQGLRVFSPKKERSRSPLYIMITVETEKPSWPGTKNKRVAGRSIVYETHEEEGGSGGTAVRLRAWVESGGRFIVLNSMVQPDSGGDDQFHAEWAILPTLRWVPPK